MMKGVVGYIDMTKELEFFLDEGDMFCYCCGVSIFCIEEECETDRFGRNFCCEACRKKYYGGKDV